MLKSGYIFTPFEAPEQSPFDRLFDIFSELITHTSGDVDEALDWLYNQITMLLNKFNV